MVFSSLRQVSELFKLRIGLVIGLTALSGLLLAPGAAIAPLRALVFFLAVVLASASAGAYNQWWEHELDRGMRRTSARLFATGRLHAGPAWLAGIVALGVAGVGLAAASANPAAALYTFLGAFTYGVVYTRWLKMRTVWNIVVGGLAGSFAVLAGGAVADGTGLSPLTLSFALVLFLWTPPHFWSLAIAYGEDYAGARVPMLPVVVGTPAAARWVHRSAQLLVAATLVPVVLGLGLAYLLVALGAGAFLLSRTGALARAPSRRTAMASFFASLVQLALVLGAAVTVRLLGAGAA